jgi:hypothetical protein
LNYTIETGDYVPTPPVDKPTPRNVLIIHAHPNPESLSNLLLDATKEGKC